MRITIDDIRKSGFCVRGVRRWFQQHDIPFNDFLANGIDADEFVARGDDYAALVVKQKREREGG